MSSSTSSSDAPRVGWKAGLLRLFAFVAVNALILWLVGLGLEQLAVSLDHNVRKARSMMVLRGESHAILAVGNSVTQQAWDPGAIDPITGASSFNLASGGQSMVATELVLRHYLKHNAAPELVVVGVFVNRPSDGASLYPEIWGHLDAAETRLYRERHLQYEERSLPLSYSVFNAIPAYRYRKALDNGIKYLVAGDERIMEHRRGFLISRYHPAGPQQPLGAVEADFDLAGLRRIAEVADSHGARVLLFEPPNTPGQSELTSGRAEVLQALEALVEEEPHILEFRSFNDDNGLEYGFDEWTGHDHLNEAGAARLGREQLGPWVSDWLSRLGGGA